MIEKKIEKDTTTVRGRGKTNRFFAFSLAENHRSFLQNSCKNVSIDLNFIIKTIGMVNQSNTGPRRATL